MKKIASRTLKWILLAAGCCLLLFLVIAITLLSQIPSEKEIRGCLTTKLYQVHLCPDSGNYVKYNSISPFLVKAVVLTEDSAFWQHSGFDFLELQRSVETNLKKGRYARGGSTITQQLAKNLFLTKDKTLIRKGLEALITIRLEKFLTKKEILEKYLNVVQFGKDIYGIKKAAQFYFHKSPSELDVVEAAFFAMLLPNPEGYSKSFYKKQLTPFARARLNQILNNLYQYERISADDYEEGRAKLSSMWGGATPIDVPAEVESSGESEEQMLDEEFNSVNEPLSEEPPSEPLGTDQEQN